MFDLMTNHLYFTSEEYVFIYIHIQWCENMFAPFPFLFFFFFLLHKDNPRKYEIII